MTSSRERKYLFNFSASIFLSFFFLLMGFLGFSRFGYEWEAYKNKQTIDAVVASVDYEKNYKAPVSTKITYKYYDINGQLRWKRESISNLVKTKDYKSGDIIKLYLGRDGKYFFIDSKKHVYESFFVGFTGFLSAIFCIFVTAKHGKKFWRNRQNSINYY